jgi:ParB family chromosome partitioning protein
LALPVFYGSYFEDGTCLDIRGRSAELRGSAEAIAESRAGKRFADGQANWASELPKESEQLWDWLLSQDSATLMGVLAVASAATINAVRKPHERADHERFGHADKLASALKLDMATWWQPTGPAYLARVSKKLVLEAVAEGVTPEAAENLSKLKKEELVAAASGRLAGTGWLPTILRKPIDPQAIEALAAE